MVIISGFYSAAPVNVKLPSQVFLENKSSTWMLKASEQLCYQTCFLIILHAREIWQEFKPLIASTKMFSQDVHN